MFLFKIIVIIFDIIVLYNIVKFIISNYYRNKYIKEMDKYEYYWEFIRSDEMINVLSKNKSLYTKIINIHINMTMSMDSYKKAYNIYRITNEEVYSLIKEYLPGEKQKIRNNIIEEILN